MNTLSNRWLGGMAWLISGVWFYLLPIRRGVAVHNVGVVFPQMPEAERRQLIRRCFHHWILSAFEALMLPLDVDRFSRDDFEWQGLDVLQEAFQQQRGFIGVAGHIGSLAMILRAMYTREVRVAVPVKSLGFGPANRMWMQQIRRFGFIPLATKGVKGQLRQALSDKRIIGFVVDQHMPAHRAIVCEFFGRLAATTPVPARYALEYDVPIVPVFSQRLPSGKHLMRFERFLVEKPHQELAANIRHNTERLNRLVESWIREAPEQWLWLHKRWKVHEHPEGWVIPDHLLKLRS